MPELKIWCLGKLRPGLCKPCSLGLPLPQSCTGVHTPRAATYLPHGVTCSHYSHMHIHKRQGTHHDPIRAHTVESVGLHVLTTHTPGTPWAPTCALPLS